MSSKPHISESYEENYFEARHAGQDLLRERSYEIEREKILQRVQSGDVLDVGCGMGNFLMTFNDDWNKYGIEISRFAAEKASSNGIKILEKIPQNEKFDLIIWRGVFQHLDCPLKTLDECIRALKPGGWISFLATPNSNSICYKLFNTLPMLDPKLNFVIPSDNQLKQILLNKGLENIEIQFPYLESPYSKPLQDHIKFILRLCGLKTKFPFWKNMMEVFAQKGH